MRRQLFPALVMLALFTVLTGVVYPLMMTGFAQVAFHDKANGSLVERDGDVVGSRLIGQDFTSIGSARNRKNELRDIIQNDFRMAQFVAQTNQFSRFMFIEVQGTTLFKLPGHRVLGEFANQAEGPARPEKRCERFDQTLEIEFQRAFEFKHPDRNRLVAKLANLIAAQC